MSLPHDDSRTRPWKVPMQKPPETSAPPRPVTDDHLKLAHQGMRRVLASMQRLETLFELPDGRTKSSALQAELKQFTDASAEVQRHVGAATGNLSLPAMNGPGVEH